MSDELSPEMLEEATPDLLTLEDEAGNDTWKPTEDAAITIEKVTITTYPGPAAGDEAASDSSVG